MAVLNKKSQFSIHPFKGPPNVQYLSKFKGDPNKLPNLLEQSSLTKTLILVH
jgi:hypothetical protein